jgi:hypothetical protein
MMPAHAGSYAQAVEDQRVCGEVAKSTAELYIWKQRGITWEKATEGTNKDPYGKDPKALMYLSAEAAWSEYTHSAEDAANRAWGKCMDRLTGN